MRIGVCSGPADAALVRSAFSAHDLHVVIGAEQHANLLGGLGGGFLRLDIWVDDEDADEATALLADLRGATPDDTAFPPDDSDEPPDDVDDHELDNRLALRRGTGIAVLTSLIITFGTGHMFTGAWKRGLTLAGLEGLGIWYLAHGVAAGGLLVGGSIFLDLCGALMRLRSPKPTIPTARIHR
ncbi:MAG: DUF2007 domain-containing protein [Proteobacteria bacterium]|nr:DUF2007 domain-containing protein [Pseudomonadota bacterium]